MTRDCSSAWRRRATCDSERPAFSASSARLEALSRCREARIFRSNSSIWRSFPSKCGVDFDHYDRKRRVWRPIIGGNRTRRRHQPMGPYPHDAPPPEISTENPAGTDGFEFVEFAHPEPQKLAELFGKFGFTPV